MSSATYANVNFGNQNANPLPKGFSAGEIDWSKVKALAPLEACQVSLIPPSADVSIKNNTISFTAENPFGDSSFGTITSTGSHIAIDEKGTVKIKAASPVAEDLTCGRVEVEAQSNLRLNVGTSLAINVNTTGQHDEEGAISNSSTQSVDDKRYPAFSINVSNGGLDIECADGDIHFSGKNIVFNAAETLTLNATRAVNILAGFEGTEVFAKAAAGLFGFELPASGGGEVVIKAGKFVNDANVSESSASKTSEKTGGAKIQETGSSMSTTSLRQAGDLNLSTSGNVWLAAGQKMRIEAQGTVVNSTGPAVPPVWGVSQQEALVITANKNSTPLDTAMKIEVDNGDFVTKVSKIGDIGIITETGLIGVLAGAGKAAAFTGNPGDLVFKSYKGNIDGEAALQVGFLGGNAAGIGVGKAGVAKDFIAAFKPGFGYDKGTGGVTMKTSTGIASVLGKLQAGMGIGENPGASTNFLAFNPSGALLKITGPFTNSITGAVTTQITGANTFNVTGANTSNVTGANTANVTGLIANKSQTGVTIDSPGNVTIKADGSVNITAKTTVRIDGPSGIFLN
jgi:hypothetical protein